MIETLKDKVVLITGAAGRIGSSLAKRVCDKGGSAVLVDISEERLMAVAANLPPGSHLVCLADASSPEKTDECIASANKRFGRIDAAVHSAYPRSAGWGTAFEDITPQYLSEDLTNQLGGAILFSQRMLAYFKKQGFGNLIHVSSIQGIAAPKFEHYAETNMVSPIEYSAIKAALIASTRYLAKYYKGCNIRVNCISPGGILEGQPSMFLERYKQACNDKGMLEPDDVVGALMFLLSDDSRYVTGQNIVVDDGWSL